MSFCPVLFQKDSGKHKKAMSFSRKTLDSTRPPAYFDRLFCTRKANLLWLVVLHLWDSYSMFIWKADESIFWWFFFMSWRNSLNFLKKKKKATVNKTSWVLGNRNVYAPWKDKRGPRHLQAAPAETQREWREPEGPGKPGIGLRPGGDWANGERGDASWRSLS